MTYRPPLDDFAFLFDKVLGYARLSQTDRFAEAAPDMAQAVLAEAGRMCADVLAPLNRAGDLHPATLENGVVRTSPGFAEGYRAIAEGGWIAISADPEFGGMGLPQTLTTAVNEMLASSCLSLSLNPLMTQGQIEALEHHASDEIKAIYLPRLISGEWSGTMNLTEPQAGSDVGALRTRAEPNGDGTYAISGQKIFISWGDNDFTGNVCHLVLARLPDGAPGTRGISLFMVPKFIPDENGDPGTRNSLRVVSLEHKLGLHGSPTAVMEYDRATGWLIGEPHKGMRAMFTMMNNARLGVGVEGLGVAEAATQAAVAFALERKQGRSPIEGGHGTIIDHADVRRMLMEMKARTFAARAICLMTAIAIDMARATGEEGWSARAALLTPIAKAFGTETGIDVANLGIQVHGGMGFIEETGVAQFLRDVRVTAIYEGTNGIQAMDLVGRKLADGGAAAFALIDEIAADAGTGDDPVAQAVARAAGQMRAATEWMLAAGTLNDRFAGATPYLRAFALTIGGWAHMQAARAAGGGVRSALATYFARQILPAVPAHLAAATEGADPLYAIAAEDFAA